MAVVPRSPRPLARRAALLHVVAAAVAAASAAAQSADVVRGRITDDSAHVVAGATIHVTRGPDRLVRQTATDFAGRYSVRFDEGTGDYLVAVTAAGYRPARRRVQRQQGERELVADFVLGRDLSLLAAVKVRAQRPTRASNAATPFSAEPGSSERWSDGVDGRLAPTVAGDLAALAGTIPGVTLTAAGPSILGAGPESNLTTLNGMGMGAAAIPRAARVEARVTGASFDPTRGGFAGANVDVRLGEGSRSYQRRNAYLTLDAPALQFTDAVGRAVGAAAGGLRGSVGADGELVRRALTYNVALDVARSASEPATLLGADEATLLRAGVSPDSVARLVTVAGPLGLPLTGRGIPGTRERNAVTWLGRLDDTRDSLARRTLTSYAGLTRQGAVGFGPLAAPSAGGEQRDRTAGAQLVVRSFVGAGRRILNEARAAAGGAWTDVSPYRAIPGATVLVRSPALDARSDVTALAVGGSSSLAGDEARWTLEGANETDWNARGSRHRFRALLWGRGDGLRQEPAGNRLGSYAFNSIADLAAGRAASYSRTLVQPARAGATWNAAAALAHQWAPSRFFSVLYGARLEASGFGDAPPANPALERALGVRTGVAPTRLHASPRAGFSYTYNRDKDNGNGSSQNPVGRFYRNTTGVVRGGVGEFRDLLRPGIVADAAAGAGLPGSMEVLTCVGAAAPTPDWTRIAADPSALPTQCEGGGALAERARAVTLIDPSYDVPRSWRASLDWQSNVGSWLVRASGLASYDLSQPGTVDANFAGATRFTLDAEGGRPVFVSAAAIDPASGAVSAAESRRTAAFGRVAVRGSDLRGYGGLLTLAVSPDLFRMRRVPGSLFASGAYTLQATRRQYRGFDGAGFGDPREREWAPGPADARHGLILQGGFSTRRTGTVTLFARAQSGMPFTPLVQGDVNGDGRPGDRAFVPDVAPGRDGGDPALAAQLRALLADGSPTARRCLAAQAGAVAARNGCRGPWTQSLNVQWRPPIRGSFGRRATAAVHLQNVLGGADQLVHGRGDLRGWGAAAYPDPVLLVPRGFDAAARRFRYDVNPRFGDTRGARTLTREPFRISIDVSVDLAVRYDMQQLRRALEPVRSARGEWERRSADSIAAFYLATTSNIHAAMLAESDSLFLTAAQAAAFRRADSAFSERVRAVFVPLGRFLSRLPEGAAGKAALDSVAASERAYWTIFWEQPEIADSIVTPTQRELMPLLKGMVAVPRSDRERSKWQFGSPVTFAPAAGAAPVAGGDRKPPAGR